MKQTAVIYRWNSLRRQYKSETPFGNPIFPYPRFLETGDFRHRFFGRFRLLGLRLSRLGIGFDEAAGAGQQEIEGRNRLPDVKASATSPQQQKREQWRAAQNLAGGDH